MNHEDYMRIALDLARWHRGRTRPNPTVGAVIVRDHRIVGIGYHLGKGTDHAEVVALKAAGDLARGATLYVTLEPHSFHGTTPPCTEAIIRAGIQHVVVAVRDPFPRVRGTGIQQLKEAGIRVTEGVLAEEARRLNEAYFKFHETGLPWVTLKVALTLDGFIAQPDGRSQWVTSAEARRWVHRLRGEHDAVLIGAGTARTDDPLLTPREVFAFHSPRRLILSHSLNLPAHLRLFQTPPETVVLTDHPNPGNLPVPVWRVPDLETPEPLLRLLASHGIQSVLVEGGARVFSWFLRHRAFDRLILIYSPKILGRGLGAFGGLQETLEQEPAWEREEVRPLGPDLAVSFRRKSH